MKQSNSDGNEYVIFTNNNGDKMLSLGGMLRFVGSL